MLLTRAVRILAARRRAHRRAQREATRLAHETLTRPFTQAEREAIFGDHDLYRPGSTVHRARVDPIRNPAFPNYRPR